MRPLAAYAGPTERLATLGRWRGAPSYLTAKWPFPTAAALGSFIRAKGIEREIRARLNSPGRKTLYVADGWICLSAPPDGAGWLSEASGIVAAVLNGIDALPVLPGEVDDILAIAPRERLRWTKDGRLQSGGTRTAALHGEGRTVAFHVFDPLHIEDVLDRGLADVWREEDIEAAAEVRRRAAGRAALTRANKKAGQHAAEAAPAPADDAFKPKLDRRAHV